MGRQQIDALTGSQHLGHVTVEGRMIGVHEDLHLARGKDLIEVVVHGSPDESHAKRHDLVTAGVSRRGERR